MNDGIKDNKYDLYALYKQYSLLFDFWQTHKNIKDIDEIKNRIEYIQKNKINQRSEIETLLCVIGELDDKTINN